MKQLPWNKNNTKDPTPVIDIDDKQNLRIIVSTAYYKEIYFKKADLSIFFRRNEFYKLFCYTLCFRGYLIIFMCSKKITEINFYDFLEN